MKSKLPDLSASIKEKDILNLYNSTFQTIASDWYELNMVWLVQSYKNFKDHDKYLILIYIVKKTFDYYSSNFINLSFVQFHDIEKLEIEKFNIIDISKNLKISRETARRKISELERDGIIQKNKKKLLVKRGALKFQKPVIVLKHIIKFLNKVSKICVKNSILNDELSKAQLEKTIHEKFSYIWKLWYEMLIPNLITWKKIHKDLESYHIFGTIVLNQTYETNKYLSKKKFNINNRIEYVHFVQNFNEKTGINAMSIANLTGIPRATVIRKLKVLIKKKVLHIDEKKHYHLYIKELKNYITAHNNVIIRLF